MSGTDVIYLAALLHDIGKFYQRAGKSSHYAAQFKLSDDIKKLESSYCPPDGKGNYSHRHALWTAQFIRELEEKHPVIGKTAISLDGKQVSLMRLAASHHKPSNLLEGIIQLADQYSSGIDRQEKINEEEDQKTIDRVRMVSLFETLGMEKNASCKHTLPLKSLNLQKDFFPLAGDQTTDQGYPELWKAFFREIMGLDAGHLRTFSEAVLNILEKYTIAIPSSTIHLPDISLFDHLKTTAAFAVALYQAAVEKNLKDLESLKKTDNLFLLAGADLSGVQAFLYDIPSRKAARNLKGRSFYLQLLSDTIFEYLVRKLNITRSQLVYGSGGRFFMILPNTDPILKKWDEARDFISEKLFDEHGTSLFVAMETEPFGGDEIFGKSIHVPWKNLIAKLNERKSRRYEKQLITGYNLLFEPQVDEKAMEYSEAEDNAETATGEKKFSQRERMSRIQASLGKWLTAHPYWICTSEEIPSLSARTIQPGQLGIWHYLADEADVEKAASLLAEKDPYAQIRRFNDVEYKPNERIGNLYVGYAFYGGNAYPTKTDGHPVTFDELAGLTKQDQDEAGYHRLGIVRMDVDNLGALFAEGFPEKYRTFSRYSALSRQLDWFFKGYINTIWNRPGRKENTYILYSGGDDLFLVGKWNEALAMAMDIYREFREWTCHQPKITLSGGIAVVPGKFPVKKAARDAGEAEDKAKKHTLDKCEKNAFTLLGCPLNWEYELPVVEEYKNRILAFLKAEKIPAAFIGKIRSHHDHAVISKGEICSPKTLWMVAYDLGRMAKRTREKEAAGFIAMCQKNIFTNQVNGEPLHSSYHFLQLLNLAARWAELEYRTCE